MVAAGDTGDTGDAARSEALLLLTGLAAGTGDAELATGDISAEIPVAADLARWAASGAMLLTGDAAGPPSAPPAPVASRLIGAAAVLELLGGPRVDAPALLGERAALRGLRRRGSTTAGGAGRLLPTADGWLAVSLPRAEDGELVPAWLHVSESSWEAVAAEVGHRPAAVLADEGQELGLAVAAVPTSYDDVDEQVSARGAAPWLLTRGDGPATSSRLTVLDLSALWAGPLCAHLLGLAGASVVTVDSVGRPDGAREGDPGLYQLLHAGHAFRSLDLRIAAGRDDLRALLDAADVVVTSARPRGLESLGLDPAQEVTTRPGLTWVAITGYGLTGPWRNRVGFGDDAAAAGGLVAPGATGPVFCADALADPCTGIYAAVAALALSRRGGGLVDIALRDVARHLARPPLRTQPAEVTGSGPHWRVATPTGGAPVGAPRARRP